jgi:hypothetical protein
VALSDLYTYVEHCHHHILRTAHVEASTLQEREELLPMIINGWSDSSCDRVSTVCLSLWG